LGMLAALVFPYVQKELFEASPPLVRKKIAGIPLMSVFAGITFITMLYALTVYVQRPDLSGPVSLQSAMFLGGTLAIFALLYYAYRAYHLKRMGIDIGMAFKEIPPT
jgi:APA family basic amino acid/polyamine antiporter